MYPLGLEPTNEWFRIWVAITRMKHDKGAKIRRITTPTLNELQIQMKRYPELYRKLFDFSSIYYNGKY